MIDHDLVYGYFRFCNVFVKYNLKEKHDSDESLNKLITKIKYFMILWRWIP